MRAHCFARLSLPLIAIAMTACGFPEVETVPAEGPSTSSSSAGSGGHGGAPTTTASVTTAVASSGSGGAPATSSVASSAASSAQSSSSQSASASGSGGAVNCDVDGDMHDGPQCGGDDCDDNDNRTHPMQTNYFSDKPSNTTKKWDFDCDGVETQQYTMAVACNKGGQCPKTNIFIAAAPPACGMSAPYGNCVSDAIVSCKPGTPLGSQIQPCR